MKKVIIDVGTSHNAPRGLQLRSKYNLPVLFIEANKEALDMVPAGVNDIKLNIAITSYDGEVEFNFYQEGTHSILETNLDDIHRYIDGYSGTNGKINDWKAWKKEIVKCNTLKTVLENHNIDYVQHLKVDTQGHDFEVVKSLGYKISIVKFIECEVQVTDFEIYKNQSKKDDLVKFLTEKGFKLISTEKQTFNQEENLIFENNNLN